MKKLVIAAATAVVAFATPAMAQDADLSSGAYVGVLVGWDHIETDGVGGSGGKDGVVYGAVLGYDARVGGSAVVGLEAEIGGASTKESEEDVLALGDKATIKAGRDLYAGVRLGFEASPGLVIYAKGGYANGKIIAEYTDPAGAKLSESVKGDGYRIGAGVQKTLTGNIGARIEYRYTDYGTLRYAGFSLDQDAKRHQVVVALIGKF